MDYFAALNTVMGLKGVPLPEGTWIARDNTYSSRACWYSFENKSMMQIPYLYKFKTCYSSKPFTRLSPLLVFRYHPEK
jgi:hypothetical protein